MSSSAKARAARRKNKGNEQAKSAAKSTKQDSRKSPPTKKGAKRPNEATNSVPDDKKPKAAKVDETGRRAELKAKLELIRKDKRFRKVPKKECTAYDKMVCKQTTQALWKGCKFFTDEFTHVEKGARFVMDYCKPKEFNGLSGEDLEMAQAIWIWENADIVRKGLNKQRNYCKDFLQLHMKSVFAEGKEDEYPTPEDIDDLCLRKGMEDLEDANCERNMVKYTNMVDYLLPKVAGAYYFGEVLHHTEPALTASSSPDTDMEPMRGVSPSDFAMLGAYWHNYYAQWLYDAKKERFLMDKQPDPTTGEMPAYVDDKGNPLERPETPYTKNDKGVPKLGGWNLAGRKVFYKLQKKVIIAEANEEDCKRMLAADQEALRRMRQTHNMAEREAKRGKRGKPKVDFLAKQDGESDIEVEDCLG